jgi:cold shock CspA family protein
MTEQLPFRGRMKTWKKAIGYGFVTRSDDFRDVFVHAIVLKGTGFAVLEPGQRVLFDRPRRSRLVRPDRTAACPAVRPSASFCTGRGGRPLWRGRSSAIRGLLAELAELAEAEAAGMAADLSRDDLEALGPARPRFVSRRPAPHSMCIEPPRRRPRDALPYSHLGDLFADFSPVIGAESPRKRGAEPFWPKARDWQPFL